MTKYTLPSILTAQNIADYLGISRRVVYELLSKDENSGGIKCIQIGSSKRVGKEDFLNWIEERKSEVS